MSKFIKVVFLLTFTSILSACVEDNNFYHSTPTTRAYQEARPDVRTNQTPAAPVAQQEEAYLDQPYPEPQRRVVTAPQGSSRSNMASSPQSSVTAKVANPTAPIEVKRAVPAMTPKAVNSAKESSEPVMSMTPSTD